MTGERIEYWDRIIFKSGQAVAWFQSFDMGATWQEVDCSLYPDQRLPFAAVHSAPSTDTVYCKVCDMKVELGTKDCPHAIELHKKLKGAPMTDETPAEHNP